MNHYIKKLRKNPPSWTKEHTKIVQRIKQIVKHLPFLGIPHPHAFMIAKADASRVGYEGILKQNKHITSYEHMRVSSLDFKQNEQLVRYHSGI